MHNVDQMLREMSQDQLEEWMVYADLEPFDEKRADIRAAQITSAIYNVNRTKKHKVIKITDTLIRFGDDEPAKKETPWQSMKEMARMMFLQSNVSRSKTGIGPIVRAPRPRTVAKPGR